MRATEHILVDENVKEFLEEKKIHPRESFNDVLKRELKIKNLEEKGKNNV